MTTKDTIKHINEGYTTKGEYYLGGYTWGEAIADTLVKNTIKNFKSSRFIAGATGTGKTKTIQVLCEQLSSFGIPT
jgi:Cdc6-like AAA superfamily ATPase